MKYKKFRASILPIKGSTYGANFCTKDKCDEFILVEQERLEQEKNGIKKACIYNRETTDKEFIRFDK